MALPFECKRRSQLSTCRLVPSPPSCSRKRVVTNPTFRCLRYLQLASSYFGRCVVICCWCCCSAPIESMTLRSILSVRLRLAMLIGSVRYGICECHRDLKGLVGLSRMRDAPQTVPIQRRIVDNGNLESCLVHPICERLMPSARICGAVHENKFSRLPALSLSSEQATFWDIGSCTCVSGGWSGTPETRPHPRRARTGCQDAR